MRVLRARPVAVRVPVDVVVSHAGDSRLGSGSALVVVRLDVLPFPGRRGSHGAIGGRSTSGRGPVPERAVGRADVLLDTIGVGFKVPSALRDVTFATVREPRQVFRQHLCSRHFDSTHVLAYTLTRIKIGADVRCESDMKPDVYKILCRGHLQ